MDRNEASHSTVKTILVLTSPNWKNAEQSYLSSFHATLQNGFKSLTNPMQTTSHAYCSTALRDVTLPNLSRVETYLTADAYMLAFLNRHPEVEVLILSGYTPLHFNSPIPRTIDLPKLRYYAGNASCLESFIQNFSLRAAFISREYLGDVTLLPALRVLERTSLILSRVGGIVDGTWILSKLFRYVSQTSPGYDKPHYARHAFTPEYVDTMKLYLSKFTRLQRLSMHFITQWYDE